jgi:HD-GYP domain-containing protein (c-di-GMP phosphodiesterase class II)
METIRISQIRPGQTFATSLFSRTGQKLLPAHTPLNERQVQAMRRYGDLEVFAANSLSELVEAGLVEPVHREGLAVGQRRRRGLMTGSGQMLVAPGEEVEQHHVDAAHAAGTLYSAGFEAEADDPAEDEGPAGESEHRQRMLLADGAAEDLEQRLHHMPLRVPAGEGDGWVSPADPRNWPEPTTLALRRNQTVASLRELFAHIEAGQAVEVAAFYELIDQLVEKLSRHPRRFAQLALLCPRREDYLPDHAYTTAVLAMAVGAQLGWDRGHVEELGVAGLVYDLGMLMIPRRIRVGMQPLNEQDRSRVRRHPVFSVAMLCSVEGLPELVRLAALQHHERENGMGYPRGRKAKHLCDYARVLAVVDSYAATTEPRRYREAKLPYVAMEETVRGASTGSLWPPAVRGLVRAAGLFPVGSFVELSSGDRARILAANPQQYDRPLLQPVDQYGQLKDTPIDLATVARDELAVSRAVSEPDSLTTAS